MEVMAKNVKILALVAIVVVANMPAFAHAEPEIVSVDAQPRIIIDITPAGDGINPIDAQPILPSPDFTPEDGRVIPIDGDLIPTDHSGPTISVTPADGRVTPVEGELVPAPTDNEPTPTDPGSGSNGGHGSRSGSRRVVSNNNSGQVLGAEDFKFLNNLRMTMENSDVMELQKRLRAEGYFTFPTDTGYFGPITFAAVKAYQAAHPTEIGYVTGFVGPLTRAMLNK